MSVDPVIPRLLAKQDRLSSVEKDAIFDAVVPSASAKPRMRWWFGVVPAVAVAIAVVLVAPWRSSSTSHDEIAARGGGEPFAQLRSVCSGGCTKGDKITFDVQGTSGYRYFAAFSKRPDGTVLWYFPSSDAESSVDLVAQPANGVIDRSIVVGDDHPAGTYRVFGVFSTLPLTREQIRTAFDEAAKTVGPNTRVIETELVVR